MSEDWPAGGDRGGPRRGVRPRLAGPVTLEPASDPPHWWRWHPAAPPVGALVWLALAYATVVVVDVAGAGGEQLQAASPDEPAMWLLLFNPSSPTEMIVWVLLGGLVLASGSLAGRLRLAAEPRAAAFWRLVGVAGILMVLEDTANVRYRLAEWAELIGLIDGRDQWVVVEATWYAAIVATVAVAVVRHGRFVAASKPTIGFGATGVAFYAVAALGSTVNEVTEWYGGLGAGLEGLAGGSLPHPPAWNEPTVHFYLADRVFEESLEMLGAACLLAAALAFGRHLADREDRAGGRTASQSS